MALCSSMSAACYTAQLVGNRGVGNLSLIGLEGASRVFTSVLLRSLLFSFNKQQPISNTPFDLQFQDNSDREFSVEPANLPKASTQVQKIRSAPLSRSKRAPFTPKENAMLVDLEENKGWPWKRVEPKFPQRTLYSLHVHYCTKLKVKVLTKGDDIE